MIRMYDRVVIPFDIDIALNHTHPKWLLKERIKGLVIEFGKFYPDMTVSDLVEVGLWFPCEFEDHK